MTAESRLGSNELLCKPSAFKVGKKLVSDAAWLRPPLTDFVEKKETEAKFETPPDIPKLVRQDNVGGLGEHPK